MPVDDRDTHSTPQLHDPDPHGQAALLLMESLLHGLLERNILTIDDAIAISGAAAEVKEQVIEEQTESAATGRHSLELITRITNSLMVDRPDDR